MSILNCMKMVSCKVMTIETRSGISGIRSIGGPRGVGVLGHQGVFLRLAGSIGPQGPEGV